MPQVHYCLSEPSRLSLDSGCFASVLQDASLASRCASHFEQFRPQKLSLPPLVVHTSSSDCTPAQGVAKTHPFAALEPQSLDSKCTRQSRAGRIIGAPRAHAS